MTGGHHFGSRLVFSRDKTLFVTLGDRNIGRASVQTLDNHIGKVVRIDRDGKAPADNPVPGHCGRTTGTLVRGPSQHPGRRPASGDRRTLDRRTWAQGRR